MVSVREHEALRLGRSIANVLLTELADAGVDPDDQRMLWVGLCTELERYSEVMMGSHDANAVLRDANEGVLVAQAAVRALADSDSLDSLAFALRGYVTPRRTKLVAADILERLAIDPVDSRQLRFRRDARALLRHRDWLLFRRYAP